jgi:hypothetical protein
LEQKQAPKTLGAYLSLTNSPRHSQCQGLCTNDFRKRSEAIQRGQTDQNAIHVNTLMELLSDAFRPAPS